MVTWQASRKSEVLNLRNTNPGLSHEYLSKMSQQPTSAWPDNRRGDQEKEDRALREQGREIRGGIGGRNTKYCLFSHTRNPDLNTHTHTHIHAHAYNMKAEEGIGGMGWEVMGGVEANEVEWYIQMKYHKGLFKVTSSGTNNSQEPVSKAFLWHSRYKRLGKCWSAGHRMASFHPKSHPQRSKAAHLK